LKVEAKAKRQIDSKNGSDSANVFKIDFGISLPGATVEFFDDGSSLSRGFESGMSLISNVTNDEHDEASIPGDVLHLLKPQVFEPASTESTQEQKIEHFTYRRCTFCKQYTSDCVCPKK
jgi:hypothetical protein